ncbi:hypothetical protein SAMD00023353_1600670 [Rosellinia necatrix]|uniref:Uncharacterized protein n=1 Tax=Rosellinia necatrix TaxID=77044 RepID=A0A1W2TIE1_ROSNE|nr:hypothetical protein SAMD00023353_1600670 [Rosellinia necatrix]
MVPGRWILEAAARTTNIVPIATIDMRTDPIEYDAAWEATRSRLSNRFYQPPPPPYVSREDYHGPSGQGEVGESVLFTHRDRPAEPSGRISPPNPSKPSNDHQPSDLDMLSFTKWLKQHMRNNSTPGKDTDLAVRLFHNVSDFVIMYGEFKGICKSSQQNDSETKDHYKKGQDIRQFFYSISDRYMDPFRKRDHPDQKTKTKAQEDLKKMFSEDHDKWDGFLWHVLQWIAHRRHLVAPPRPKPTKDSEATKDSGPTPRLEPARHVRDTHGQATLRTR